MKKLLARLKSDNSGFSLTELIVTMSVISLAATLSSAKIDDVLPAARDSQRQANIHQIQTALHLYYSDNGQYPVTHGSGLSRDNWNIVKSALEDATPTPYMPEVPNDPLNDDHYHFKYWSDGQTFQIGYDTEDPHDESPRIAWGL